MSRMRDRARSFGMAALVILAAVSAGAAGEPRRAAPAQGAAQAAQPATEEVPGQGATPEAEDGAGESTGLNAVFAFPVSNRCEYRASVRGVVNTAEPWEHAGEENPGALLPSLHIEGTLRCPEGVSVSVTDTLAAARPMTRAELEAELERRAAVPTLESAGRCSYAPDLLLSDWYFTSVGVTYLCAADEAAGSAQDAAR